MSLSAALDPKEKVARHWEAEACGTRGIEDVDRRSFFSAIEAERYNFEPFILDFAGFKWALDKNVLEVGVGAGTDYVNWLRAGARAIGVDLTNQALRLTHERCTLEALPARLARTDCENLPFVSNAFDIVYSYGVIHHSPGTIRAVEEIHRVLKTGGVARVMVYHAPSITGAMLWLVHCLLKLRPWKSPRWAVANFLESPGTKAYTFAEAKQLFSAFRSVKLETALGTGDLLLMRPSRRYQNPLARIAWRLYPRWAVRTFGRPFGLGLLITASK